MSLTGNGRGAINPAMQEKAGSLFKEMQQMADPNNVMQLQTQDMGIAGKFPVQLGTADPMDVQMGLRQQVVDANGMVDGMGMAIADQPVFDYLERKKEDLFMAQFQAYVNAQANLGSPAEAQWWFEKFPWLRQKRLEEIGRAADLQRRLAEIQVTGIQNEEDMKLLFAIQQGLIEMPKLPLQEMYNEDKYKNKNFVKGLFSPLSVMPPRTGGTKGKIGLPTPDLGGVPEWKNPLKGRITTNKMPDVPAEYKNLFPGKI